MAPLADKNAIEPITKHEDEGTRMRSNAGLQHCGNYTGRDKLRRGCGNANAASSDSKD